MKAQILILAVLVVACTGQTDPCAAANWDVGPIATFNPFWMFNSSKPVASCLNLEQEKNLMEATMKSSFEQRKLNIPFAEMTALFQQPNTWPTWNFLFATVDNTKDTFQECNNLNGTFHILPNIKFGDAKLTAPQIVLVDIQENYLHFAWTYGFFNPAGEAIAFGRHDYALAPAMCGKDTSKTWLLSWEKAGGSVIEGDIRVEEHTLQKATFAALDGAKCLEDVYAQTQALNVQDVQKICGTIPARQKWEDLLEGGYYSP